MVLSESIVQYKQKYLIIWLLGYISVVLSIWMKLVMFWGDIIIRDDNCPIDQVTLLTPPINTRFHFDLPSIMKIEKTNSNDYRAYLRMKSERNENEALTRSHEHRDFD